MREALHSRLYLTKLIIFPNQLFFIKQKVMVLSPDENPKDQNNQGQPRDNRIDTNPHSGVNFFGEVHGQTGLIFRISYKQSVSVKKPLSEGNFCLVGTVLLLELAEPALELSLGVEEEVLFGAEVEFFVLGQKVEFLGLFEIHLVLRTILFADKGFQLRAHCLRVLQEQQTLREKIQAKRLVFLMLLLIYFEGRINHQDLGLIKCVVVFDDVAENFRGVQFEVHFETLRHRILVGLFRSKFNQEIRLLVRVHLFQVTHKGSLRMHPQGPQRTYFPRLVCRKHEVDLQLDLTLQSLLLFESERECRWEVLVSLSSVAPITSLRLPFTLVVCSALHSETHLLLVCDYDLIIVEADFQG